MLKEQIWRLLDPAIRRLSRRMEHLRALDSRQSLSKPGIELAESSVIHPEASFINLHSTAGRIRIGARTQVLSQLITYWEGGQIVVGEDSYLGIHSRIWSNRSITIGNRVLISHLVDIHDFDGHPLSPMNRHRDVLSILGQSYEQHGTKSAPVVIGDDAWICLKATVLKGVTIGRGAIVAAGAVVVKDVPEMVIVAGNPARVVADVPRDRLGEKSPSIFPQSTSSSA